MSTRQLGEDAERAAERFYLARGFRTVARNYRARTGEIDLIMSQDRLLAFVEVRLRRNPHHGSGAESVTVAKQRRLIHTAQRFLQDHRNLPWDQYRFDVVSIGREIHWIPGAFTLD